MKNWLIGKDPDAGKDWRQEEKGTTEDEMVGWHYWLDGHGFEQTPSVGDGLGGLVCWSPWCHRVYNWVAELNWTFDCVDHNKLWKVQEMGIPDHLTCILRNLYAGQEATVRNAHGTTDWFQTGKGVSQGCILSPCLFNLYAEYIMWNTGLDEAQAGINIAGRNINNLSLQMTPPLWQKVKKN